MAFRPVDRLGGGSVYARPDGVHKRDGVWWQLDGEFPRCHAAGDRAESQIMGGVTRINTPVQMTPEGNVAPGQRIGIGYVDSSGSIVRRFEVTTDQNGTPL